MDGSLHSFQFVIQHYFVVEIEVLVGVSSAHYMGGNPSARFSVTKTQTKVNI